MIGGLLGGFDICILALLDQLRLHVELQEAVLIVLFVVSICYCGWCRFHLQATTARVLSLR